MSTNTVTATSKVANRTGIITSAGTLLAANENRSGLIIQNLSSANALYVCFGTGASTTVFDVILKAGIAQDDGNGGTFSFDVLSYTGIITIAGTSGLGLHVGTIPGTSNANVSGYGIEVSGSNNSVGGMNIILSNTSNGTSAFTSIFLQNDLAIPAGTHYGNVGLNSSTYNDSSFGSAPNVANQLSIFGTDGPTMVGSFAAAGYINFIAGGNSTANEIARFTTTGLQLTTGKVTKYNAIATTGQGVPSIYGTGRTVGAVAAVASVATYTVGATDGSFYISANVLVTTATLHTFTATVAYTDEGNTSRTVTLQFSTVAGAFVTAMTNAQGTVPYEGVPLHIRAKASTAITIATTGTFTTVTYNVEGSITQIS